MEWYQASRFGMFIHWGLYAIPARGEWVMAIENIPVADYTPLAKQFNPTRFNADEWVALAADAGQKWITITSRHHDGFSMYDTALSDYKVTRSPFGRDPLAELAAACARRGDVKLGFYNSLLDWHHPAYRFRKESGLAWDDYLGFLHGQVRELCTQYGEVCEFWFDGEWPGQMHTHPEHFLAGGDFKYEALYNMIHTLQPGCIIHNNRHAAPVPGEDVQGIEQDLPGENSAGFNTTELHGLPLEVSMTINDGAWGFDAADHSVKTARRLVHVLARLGAIGANLLLNVGPTADGVIHAPHAQRLRAVGQWLRANGESIYNTQPGVFGVSSDLASTRRGKTHYVHSLNPISDAIDLRPRGDAAGLQFASAHLLGSRVPLAVSPVKLYGGAGVRIIVPAELRDPLDTVVVLTEG